MLILTCQCFLIEIIELNCRICASVVMISHLHTRDLQIGNCAAHGEKVTLAPFATRRR